MFSNLWRIIRRPAGFAVLSAICLVNILADAAFAQTVQFDLEALSKVPATHPAEAITAEGVQSFFFEGSPYKGQPTRVFAYYGKPQDELAKDANGKFPAMVLIHGGGGTAFDRWVKVWNARGYAAIAMDLCGCVPVGEYGKWQRHDLGGPPGWDASFGQLDDPIEDQWTYHAVSAAALAGLGTFCFQDAAFRRDLAQIARAALLGLLVVAAWYLSGHIGYGENPDTLETVYFATNSRTLESLSFVAPTAYSLELLLLWTDKSLHPSFGVACVAGVVLGALAHAVGSKQFRWEGFGSLQDLRNQLTGAMLMGFGGVTAVGCTIGQGLSGLSTLAIGSLIAVAGIVCGCIAAMRWLSR